MKRELPDQLQFMANRGAVQKTCSGSMRGKLCVVTGSTSGVGLETLRRLSKGGADLVMVCRDRRKAELVRDELASERRGRVDIVVADFSRLVEVRRAAAEILGKYPRIDVLVNSAGMHSTTRTLTPEGFETVFCVNHLASFLFTSLLLDRLKASAPARIIQVNSEGHRFGDVHLDDLNWERRHYTGLRGYGASKTAQLLTVWEFADRLRGSGLTINAVHPGDVRTNIGANNGILYRLFLHTAIWLFLKDPAISGEAIYWLAASPEAAATNGRFFHLTVEEKPAAHALDREKGKLVWDLSRRLTGLDT
jgi:NAD(P)-dependent dehydrogenase (short-subunit alcohol dehydrogenase family)